MNCSATFEAPFLGFYASAGFAPLVLHQRLSMDKHLRRSSSMTTIYKHDIREYSYKESDCVV